MRRRSADSLEGIETSAAEDTQCTHYPAAEVQIPWKGLKRHLARAVEGLSHAAEAEIPWKGLTQRLGLQLVMPADAAAEAQISPPLMLVTNSLRIPLVSPDHFAPNIVFLSV
jgi:hypothetical protein